MQGFVVASFNEGRMKEKDAEAWANGRVSIATVKLARTRTHMTMTNRIPPLRAEAATSLAR